MFLYFLCFGGQSKHVFKSTEHENTFLCLKGNYQFITEVFLLYPPSARPHLLVQLRKRNGICKGKTVLCVRVCCVFFPPKYVKDLGKVDVKKLKDNKRFSVQQ